MFFKTLFFSTLRFGLIVFLLFNSVSFPDETGATISVVHYFREKYGINLRYPFLPAIQAGTEAKPIYLPMEVSCCHIVIK